MTNKIMIGICSVVLAFSILGFTNESQILSPNTPLQERIDQKITFDHDQLRYNNKTNTEFRDKNLVKTQVKAKDQEKKKVEEVQDKTKGQILIKF